ncbi:OLC1v1018533C1 [Oldenlandia corymbosa var. corymbosa]|uniref:OLC1v1018533C1 n=1 Tax=Oldenlandia corymbosa var. corymbosa TaxID=529605 RepID=A0AAV1EBU8_OLDCO|nr:OLC1v1018533C1 [Oldenlandia corymbosa var. corymbosa]
MKQIEPTSTTFKVDPVDNIDDCITGIKMYSSNPSSSSAPINRSPKVRRTRDSNSYGPYRFETTNKKVRPLRVDDDDYSEIDYEKVTVRTARKKQLASCYSALRDFEDIYPGDDDEFDHKEYDIKDYDLDAIERCHDISGLQITDNLEAANTVNRDQGQPSNSRENTPTAKFDIKKCENAITIFWLNLCSGHSFITTPTVTSCIS